MAFDFDNEFSFTGEPEIQEVIERYRSMLKNNTTLYFDPHEFLLLIEHYFNNNHFEESLKIVTLALLQHPFSFELKFKKANILYRLKDYKSAYTIINELEDIEGANSAIAYFKGLLLAKQNQLKEANHYFHKAILLSNDKEETIDILLKIADFYEEKNDFESANYYLIEAHKLDPSDAEIIIEIAQNFESYDISKAIPYYNRYLNKHPFHASGWFDLGVVYSRVENFTKALEAFDFAIALYDKYAEAYFNKGNALANLGRYEEAINAFTEYHNLLINEHDNNDATDFLEVYCSIGECYERMGELNFALVHYKRALEINPAYPDAIYGIGMIHSICNNLEESVKCVKKAISLDPFNSEYYFSLGNLYLRMDKTEKAIEAYNSAIDIDPEDFESWLNLAQIYFNKNLLTKAIKTLEAAYERNDKVAIIEYRLAGYYCLKSNYEQGIALLRKALIHDNSKYFEFLKVYPNGTDDSQIMQLIEQFR